MNRTGLAVCSWLLLVAGGFGLLTRYSLQAGDAVGVLATWPVESRIPYSRDGMTLVVFLHPHCACSHATVEELSKLQSPEAFASLVPVFYRPSSAPPSWIETGLWRRVVDLADSNSHVDVDATEAKRFGVTTSGHCLLFDRAGRRLFSGGVTISRGHEGQSIARLNLDRLLRGERFECQEYPVFGCPIVSQPTSETGSGLAGILSAE